MARRFTDNHPRVAATGSGASARAGTRRRIGAPFKPLHPRRRLQEQMQRVDELHDDLLRAAQSIWKHNERRWRELAERLLRVRPELIVARQQAQLAQLRVGFELPERQPSEPPAGSRPGRSVAFARSGKCVGPRLFHYSGCEDRRSLTCG